MQYCINPLWDETWDYNATHESTHCDYFIVSRNTIYKAANSTPLTLFICVCILYASCTHLFLMLILQNIVLCPKSTGFFVFLFCKYPNVRYIKNISNMVFFYLLIWAWMFLLSQEWVSHSYCSSSRAAKVVQAKRSKILNESKVLAESQK